MSAFRECVQVDGWWLWRWMVVFAVFYAGAAIGGNLARIADILEKIGGWTCVIPNASCCSKR